MATLKRKEEEQNQNQETVSGRQAASYGGTQMSAADQAAIETAKQNYARGQQTGDRNLMNSAHAQAEAIRAKYGFSGGSDGSQYIPTGGNDSTGVSVALPEISFQGQNAYQPQSVQLPSVPQIGTTQQAAQTIQSQISGQNLTVPAPQVSYQTADQDANLLSLANQMEMARRTAIDRGNQGAYPEYDMSGMTNELRDVMNRAAAEADTQYAATGQRPDMLNYRQRLEQAANEVAMLGGDIGSGEDLRGLDDALQTLLYNIDNRAKPDLNGADLANDRKVLQAYMDSTGILYPTYNGKDMTEMGAKLDQALRDVKNAGKEDFVLRDLGPYEWAVSDAMRATEGQKFDFQGRDLSELDAQAQAAAQRVTEREPFSYDPEKDPAYQAYAKQYTRNGQRAMEDTLGRLAARTGGTASSYAASAAQQAYNNYMYELGGRIPELQKLAYDMYIGDLGQRRSDYEMLNNRYKDALAQNNLDRAAEYQQYRDDMGDSKWRFEQAMGKWKTALDQRNLDRAYYRQLQRDDVADTQWAYNAALGRYDRDQSQGNADREWYRTVWGDQTDQAWKRFEARQGLYDRDQSQGNLDRALRYQAYRDDMSDAWNQYGAQERRYERLQDQSNANRAFDLQKQRYRIEDAQWLYDAAAAQTDRELAQFNADRAMDLSRGDNQVAAAQWYFNALNNLYGQQLNQYNANRADYNQRQRYGVEDAWTNYEALANLYGVQLGQLNTENNLRRGLAQDEIARQQWNNNMLYQTARDLVEDQRDARDYNTQLWRYNVDDAWRNYDAQWEQTRYNTDRSDTLAQRAIDNALQQAAFDLDREQFGWSKSQDEIDNALRWAALELDRQQFGLSQDKFYWDQGQDNIANELAQQKFNQSVANDSISNQQAAQRLAMDQAEFAYKQQQQAQKEAEAAAEKARQAAGDLYKREAEKAVEKLKNALKKK